MILLDDDDVRAESAARILRAAGYDVEALAGAAAWRTLHALLARQPSITVESRAENDHLHLTIGGNTFKIKR